jgi:predicted ATPase
MNQSPQTTPWHNVYHELAVQLNQFYKKNKNSAGRILFKLLNNSLQYKKNNIWLVNLLGTNKPSLDPIQFFASFSRTRQNENIRTEIINTVWELITTKKRFWDLIDFAGCPAPIALKLLNIRPDTVRLQIWERFNDIMENGKAALTPELWKDIKNWRGIQIPSFTIFLFWINSDQFLPLDKNTRQYLERRDLLSPGAGFTLETYQLLLSNTQVENYAQLSLEAYYFNNDQNAFKEKSQINIKDANTTFGLIGLRTLGRNKSSHKILKSNQYYPFDHAIFPLDSEIDNEGIPQQFCYNPSNSETIYHLEDLKINITAIVGKNGSGKSSLLDLMLMGVYNLSIQLGYLNRENHKLIKNLNFEIYWHTDTLYKMVFEGEIQLYRFQRNNSEEQSIKYQLAAIPIPIESLNHNFFYSILVNYSHYALNSLDHKIDWITPLSHKNDGYMTPIVINPQRTDGNININREKDLLNMRLLLNLLELHDSDIPEQSIRYLDNGKYLKFFSVKYNIRKNKKKREEAKQQTYNDPKIIQMVMNGVARVFGLEEKSLTSKSYKKELDYYIVNKLLTIVNRYDRYRIEYKEAIDNLIRDNIASTIEGMDRILEIAFEDKIQDLLSHIKEDSSHITLKLKQSIYYLKYPLLQKFINEAIKNNKLIELDEYNKFIEKIINSNPKDNLSNVAELLPPPIFELDFYLDDKDRSSFSKASSGEYQLVSVLSSILYHIRNIDSVDKTGKYNYITVLLDEIELYFHPNMQRFFIRKLLEALSKLDNELYGIHVLFATHSPFILSDIQERKILKLKNGSIEQRENRYNSFAANIHDLLADEFFLGEGYMGAFAQKQIESAINLLNYTKAYIELRDLPKNRDKISRNEHIFLQRKLQNEIELYKEKLTVLGYWNNRKMATELDTKSLQKALYQLIEIIGEPLIQENLRNMYRITFPDYIEDEVDV